MKLFKVDTNLWTVREVEGEPYPGKDSEGSTCYINTHFANKQDAWTTLQREAEATLSLMASRLVNCEKQLEQARIDAAGAVKNVALAFRNIRNNHDHTGTAKSDSTGTIGRQS